MLMNNKDNKKGRKEIRYGLGQDSLISQYKQPINLFEILIELERKQILITLRTESQLIDINDGKPK